LIEVTVKLVSKIKAKFQIPAEVLLPEGSTVMDLLVACGVDPDRDRVIVLKKNTQVDLNHTLNHSDQVTILPAIFGG
jgi:sulfur carrier protein ThiS